MNFRKSYYKTASTELASFDSPRAECHAIIHAESGHSFSSQLESVEAALDALSHETGLQPVFKRYFLSDVANQASEISMHQDCAVSIIGQPPLDGSKIAIWTVMQEDADFRDCGDGLWRDSSGKMIIGDAVQPGGSSYEATVGYLRNLAATLERCSASLLGHCVRTWFMVRDVDLNYKGVVDGRNEEFDRCGLTVDTHFISSTGIGGTPVNQECTVAFNAICDTKLKPGQMGFLYGSSHLNRTTDYGVAFERGTTVDYNDRRHVYISGTASIDSNGDIVHPGDIAAQTRRMLENIDVLLAEAQCSFRDVASMIVYLRDMADAPVVSDIMNDAVPDVPKVMVLAPVCRPGWLIETECIAIKKASNPQYAQF